VSIQGQPAAGGDGDRDRGTGGRRRLLVTAAGLAAGALVPGCSGRSSGETAGRPVPTAPAGSPGSPGSPGTTRSAPATPAAADWSALAGDLAGRLVRPDDHDYATARLLYNPRFDHVRPAAVAFCATPADVRNCLAFARRYGVTPTPRAGGHSYLGASTGPGLVVDVSRMTETRVDTGADTAVVGAGVRLIDLYARLADRGVTVPAGTCPTVGVTGLTLGGGIGVTCRAYGLTSDNLLAAQVVTADGRIVTASASREPELFWALRGAGGAGGFGVVTSLTLRTRPVGEVTVFSLRWPWSRAAAVVRAWQAWAPAAPDELWSGCHLPGGTVDGGRAVQVSGLFLGDPAALRDQVERLFARAGADPARQSLQPTSHGQAMMIMAGCARRTVAECHLPWSAPGGELERESYRAASDIVTRPLPAAGIATLIRQVERQRSVTVLLDALGGAVNRVPAGATAFVHRDGLFTVQYLASWKTGAAPAAQVRARAWIRAARAAMRRFVSGQAYQNYPDEDLAGWAQAYYGANYPRLVRVKARYDPDRLFRPPQGIPPR
jgi:FAD/FMN-containing dehydrogenase